MALCKTNGQPTTIRAMLVAQYPNLKAAERKVADILLSHQGSCQSLDLKQLAAQAGVSQPTVIRMSQAIGFDGYREFRLRWVQEAGAQPTSSTDTAFSPIFAALKQNECFLQMASVEAAAAAIAESNQVFVYGWGGSGLVAGLAATTLSVTGRLSVAYTDEVRCTASLAYLGPEIVLFVISHRGENPVISQTVVAGKENGSKVIVLTSNAASSLAKLADILLLTGTAQNQTFAELALSPARVVQTASIYVVTQAVAAKLQESARRAGA